MVAFAVTLALVGNFSAPVYVTGPSGDPSRLFVVQKAGAVRVIDKGVVQATPFLTLPPGSALTNGEEGLLGLAFAPDYATSGRFYLYYTAAAADATTAGNDIVVAEGTRSAEPDVAA